MRLPAKYSLDALVNHLRADRVPRCIRARLKFSVLLRQDQDGFVWLDRLLLALLVSLLDSLLDVAPHIRCIVTVQINELLGKHGLSLDSVRCILIGDARVAVACDSVQIILVGLVPDDVDGLMHVYLGMLSAVFFLIAREDAVVRDLHEVDFHQRAIL